VPVGRASRHAECLRRFRLGQPGEETQGDQAGADWIFPVELGERLVQINQIVTGFVDRDEGLVEVNALHPSSALEPASIACAVDEYPPHCLGRGGKEVRPAVPMLARIAPYKPQVRLVYQCRRLQRLAGRLVFEAIIGEPTQILVNEREQMLGGSGITSFDG
jgi:hypothetical protein